jgi:GT2 family glycosyltransferase
MQTPFEMYPEIGAAFCRYIGMDSHGKRTHVSALEQPQAGIVGDWLRRIAEGQRLQTPSMVVRRSVYERLGGFDRRLFYTEDWEMWVRIAAHYPVWYEPRPLAVYRVHDVSVSGRVTKAGTPYHHLRQAIQINRAHLPPGQADEISDGLRAAAHAAIRRGHRMIGRGEMRVPLVNLREALRCSRAPSVLARLPILAAHWLVAGVRNVVRGR